MYRAKIFGWTLTVLLSALMTACPAGTPGAGQDVSQPNAAPQPMISLGSETAAMDSKPPAPASSTALESVLKEGMAYADLRKAVLEHGWTPLVNMQCKVNVVGADYEQQCKADPAMCRECDEMPELSACSGDGYCLMKFRHADSGQDLEVSSYGMIEDWNVPAEDSRLNVTKWTVTPKEKH